MRRELAVLFYSVLGAAAAVAAACVGDDPDTTTNIAPDGGAGANDTGSNGNPDAAASDAGSDAREAACDPTGPFSTPEPLPGDVNTNLNEFPGRLANEGRELWFIRGSDIFLATRATPTGPFMDASFQNTLNSGSDEVEPSIGDDGGLIVFGSNRLGEMKLFGAKRTDLDAAFGAPTPIGVDDPGEEGSPYLAANGKALYYVRANSIFVNYRNADGSFGISTEVKFTSPAIKVNPVVTDDELVIYFRGGPTAGNTDILRATRQKTDQDFGNAQPVGELNSIYASAPAWVSPDDCTIILTTQPDGGHWDLLMARRPPPK